MNVPVAENKEQSDKDNPPEFSDAAIRSFLLGSLSAAEQTAFEERLLSDDRFEARVRRAECELTDDYAFERLSITDREIFEGRFLVSTGRKQELSVSRALRERFASAALVPTMALPDITAGERLQRWLGLKPPSWRLALNVGVLILLIGTIWVVLRKPHIGERLITESKRLIPGRRPTPAKTPVTDPQLSHHATSASPTPQQETPLPPDRERTATANDAVSVVLVPGSIYDPDRIPRLDLPDSERATVHLQLAFKTNQGETHRAELSTVAGQSVFAEGPLKATNGNASIEFEVPSGVLKGGDYQVKLKRVTGGIEEGVATYYFRVQ